MGETCVKVYLKEGRLRQGGGGRRRGEVGSEGSRGDGQEKKMRTREGS